MGILLPVASGKGGVGKTAVAANLGCALAALGKTVILCDLDLGASNLHTMLGIKNRHAGIGTMMHRKDERLEELVVETGVPRLFFIPGDSLIPGTANVDFFTKKRVLRDLPRLPCDYVLLDLGAGTGYNVVDFFLTTSSGVLVTMPEITAVLNAYSFLKTTVFRMLFRSFPASSPARKEITAFISEKIEGSGRGFVELVNELSRRYPEKGNEIVSMLNSLYPRVIMNMGRSDRDLEMGVRLREITKKNLGINLEYIGFLKRDECIPHSIHDRMPLFQSHPDAQFSQTMALIAGKILAEPAPVIPRLYEDHEDLERVYLETMSNEESQA